MHRIRIKLALLTYLASVSFAVTSYGAEGESSKPHTPAKPLEWLDNYRAATDQAKSEHKHVLVHFYRAADQSKKNAPNAIDSVANIERTFSEPGIRERLDSYVLVKLPVETEIKVEGKSVKLLSHEAFSELRTGPGIAVIDYAHEKAPYHGYVVSVVPFTPGKYYQFRTSHLLTMLDLPAGTLTQRSMIFAVRIHPERPASTSGEDDPILLSEAHSHSNYQAQIRVQGHHHWDSRFQRIIGRLLGRGKSGSPVEVVAESWPSQDLMDSCVDCVASWRQSDGHWSAVSARQASYGYDIRQSDNGIWYATGIFREAK